MKRKILKLLYYFFEKDFDNLMVERFFGEIPKSLLEPSIEFLSHGKETLEPFLSILAYSLKNKAIFEGKDTKFYDGALLVIKAFLVAIRTGKKQVETTVNIEEPKESFVDNIKDFVDKGKKYIEKA